MNNDFPVNVFPDVERNAFNKFTKKNVTEDYIYENLQLKGWTCYKPFVDTGIDIIATKKAADGTQMYRYIQVKTRELVDGSFGYTLKAKDFRTDPRHFFLFFCDTVNDIILLSMYDYMKLFYDNGPMGVTHFANPTFRTNNNKLNSLKYNSGRWTWTYRSPDGARVIDFENYLNENGLSRMDNPDIDNSLDQKIAEITEMKFKMFYKINQTRTNGELFENGTDIVIRDCLDNMINYNNGDYITDITNVDNKFKRDVPDLYASHKKYIYGCFEDDGGNGNE